MRAMKFTPISLGQTASHSYWLVQLPKTFFIHLSDHVLNTSGFFHLSLRHERQLGNLGRDKKHGRSVLTGRHAGPATNTGRGVHCQGGNVLTNQDFVSVTRGTGAHGYVTTGLLNTVKRGTVYNQVFQNREGSSNAMVQCRFRRRL